MASYSYMIKPVKPLSWSNDFLFTNSPDILKYWKTCYERLTAIAQGYPYVLPDGFRFVEVDNSAGGYSGYRFPYEILLPDGNIVKTNNVDVAELNARIAEAAINKKYGIIPTTTTTTTTTTAAAAEPTQATPAPAVTVPESTTTPPPVTVPESTTASPLQVPADFYESQAASEEENDTSSYVVGGLILLGGFLLIRHWNKKKN